MTEIRSVQHRMIAFNLTRRVSRKPHFVRVGEDHSIMTKTLLQLTIQTIVIPVLLSSCATIFGKTSYPFRISTTPPGADISITDKKGREIFKGQTPTTADLKSSAGYFSKATYTVTINARGYKEQVIPVNYTLNGWYFGNILIGGFIGMLIVDPATGAMWKLSTPPIDLDLEATKETTATPTLKILELKDVSPGLKESLVRIK